MSPQIASLRLCKVTSIAFVWLFSTVRLKCVFKWPACSLRGCKVTLVAFVWFFSTVRFQMFTQRAWVSAGKVTQAAFFCVRYQMVLKMPVCGDVKSHKAVRQLLLLLQGKGNHLQNVVLLHLDLTPVWRCTWSGSALCGPPPSPPHEPELQTHSLSLLILSFLSFEKISVGVWNESFWGVEMCSLGGGDVPFWGVEMCQIWGVEMCWDEVIHNRETALS